MAGRRRLYRVLVLVLALGVAYLALPSPSAGDSTASTASPSPSGDASPSAWLDPLFAEQMAKLHVPGAEIVVVQNRQVVYSKGYGLASVERNVPVDPSSTAFRAMSISKLFTATAIMQLVEEGRVRLDADVNTYLTRDKVAATFPQPITVSDLLTHTAGFDYDIETVGTVARTPSDVLSLRDYLAAHPPVRVRPPGQSYLYSNAAYDVLGLVVEDVSGQPFAEYEAQHIFQPLGMSNSSFVEGAADAALATSYLWTNGAYQPLPPHYFSNSPSRGLTTTASDMARFIQANLEGGQVEGKRILQPATLASMQERHSPGPADLPGMAYGFNTYQVGDQLTLWKDGGDLNRWHTNVVLYPKQNAGYYIATNGASGADLIGAVVSEMDKRYGAWPDVPATPKPPADFAARASQFVGNYQPTGYSHHTISKVLLLSGGYYDASVSSPGDGTLQIRFSGGFGPYTLVESGPGVFRIAGAYPEAVFQMGADGRASELTWNGAVWERIPLYETATAQMGIAALFALIFLGGTLAGPLRLLRRRRKPSPAGLPSRLIPVVGWLIAVLDLVFLVGMALILPQAYELGMEYGMPPVLFVLFSLPLVTSVLALAFLLGVGRAWVRRTWPRGARLAYTLFAIAAIAFIPFLGYWNLLGYRW